MGFIYFIPDCRISASEFAAVLESIEFKVLSPSEIRTVSIMAATGPDDKAGLLFCDSRMDARRLNYRPSEQQWIQCINGKYWVGMWLDDVPTEESLRRTSQIGGHRVEFLPGQSYLIPTARCFPSGTRLPQPLMLTKDGKLVAGAVWPKYMAFSQAAESLWQYFARARGYIEAEEKRVMPQDLWRMVAQGLAFNYYVDCDEINLLGLITPDKLYEAALAIIDGPKILEWEKQVFEQIKKNDPPGMTGTCEPIPGGNAD